MSGRAFSHCCESKYPKLYSNNIFHNNNTSKYVKRSVKIQREKEIIEKEGDIKEGHKE